MSSITYGILASTMTIFTSTFSFSSLPLPADVIRSCVVAHWRRPCYYSAPREPGVYHILFKKEHRR